MIPKPSSSFIKLAVVFLVLMLGPLSIYLMYNRSGGPESKSEMAFQRHLRLAFMAGTEFVDLAPLTSWEWDTVCAIDSAVTREEMAAIIGFEYRDYAQLHWLPLKDHWTLLFIGNERETNWGPHRPVVPVRVHRLEHADLMLPAGSKGNCVPKDTGRMWLTRHEAPVGQTPVVASLVDTAGR